ncbi:alpha/beta hydrolase [Streptomyces sp. NHF165]|uniref:alpha/beta fold hydrolase n=1 Tax=Streptomyces sp. NHF165 TaxID=2175864 RepID=UPI00132F4FC5|nr:alpha/beta hydrolase [Streptomyces sp. NHF165]QHF95305.1 alpha/beta hydrolase [Streptomyces sp. NHF165]
MQFLPSDLIVDGVRLSYRDRGAGEPVVFLHGTPSHSYEWRNVVPHIEEAGHRAITYDLLGYGRSERPVDRDTSVAAQTDLLGGLLDALGIEQAAIVAHDIGGAVGQRFAVAHPERVRRLMIIDTVSYDSWPSATRRKIIEEQLEDHMQLPQEAFDALLARQLRMTVADGAATMAGDVLDAYLAPHRSALGRVSFFEHQMRHYDSRYTEEITGQLASLAMPVRILWGERDQWQPLTYAQQLAEDIPGARLTVVPGAGHFVMEDAPERVTEEVLDFLAGNG